VAAVGITLQAERAYLDLVGPLAEAEADYVEVAPETLLEASRGELVQNAYGREVARWVARTRLPVVAHGVGLSLGTADPADRARFRDALAQVARDHAAFGFQWYTDHLGASTLAGAAATLPIPLPHTDAAAALVRERLAELQRVVPDVGFENSVFYFLLGEWLDEPRFFARILERPRTWLLLDLHNLYTMALNLGLDARDWLARADLSKVIEIHLAGGSRSDPAWLDGGRTLRLDSHDQDVPEAVWRLLEDVAPRCSNLRGVTLERMEGTVAGADHVGRLREELRRAREVARGRR
jgi:uncharacterized protein (UPF0276 family)